MLRTMLNPVRFGFFHIVLTDEGRIDPHGRTALDVGCGGGLLAEECARLGLLVTGIDPSTHSVLTAQEHASETSFGGHSGSTGRYNSLNTAVKCEESGCN
jgi:2-polyprenyl-6-hydroxyphenyl methylase/3-demethylubiquinone-9 3-methyltransferase